MKLRSLPTTLEAAYDANFVGKFRTPFLDGDKTRYVVAYFLETNPRVVVKIDGEHTYLWFRDPRLGPEIKTL